MSEGGAEREREREREREGDTESEAGSRLPAINTEPNARLEPTDLEIVTRAKVTQLTEPPRCPYNFFLLKIVRKLPISMCVCKYVFKL